MRNPSTWIIPMSLPDGYLPREGDMLTVHMRVKHSIAAGDAEVYVFNPSQSWQTITIKLDDVACIHFRNWRPNDEVRETASGLRGTIIATHDGLVWVKTTKGLMATFEANELSPCDRPPVSTIIPPASAVVVAAPTDDDKPF